MAVSDWSPTADYNTSIDGISIAEGCAPGNLNNAIRSVMAAIASLFNSFWLTLFATTTAADARSGLGAAASGANTDITSLASTTTGTTQAVNDNSTKLSTTAYVDRGLGALSFPSVGVGQAWANKTGSRTAGSTYTSGAKAIMVNVSVASNESGGDFGGTVVVGGVTIASGIVGGQYTGHVARQISFIVPASTTYSVNPGSGGYITNWAELL